MLENKPTMQVKSVILLLNNEDTRSEVPNISTVRLWVRGLLYNTQAVLFIGLCPVIKTS